jgi:hypothetical protein
LEAFKELFDKALEKEGFAVAARDCTQAFMEKFDKGSEGIFMGVDVKPWYFSFSFSRSGVCHG